MLAVLLALSSSLVWGVSDFLGGALSRRISTLTVLLWSQLVGLVVMAVALPWFWHEPGGYLWWGFAGSIAGTAGLGLFFRALAIGTMSVVAPIAGTGLVVPVLAGLISGERPALVQLLGIAAAATGVVLASGPELRGEGASRRSVLYALIAAMGFGTAQVCMAEGAAVSVAMTQLSALVAGLLLVGVGVVVARPALLVATADRLPISAIGVCNVIALGTYAQATRSDLLAVVAVLASLYPVVTVLLARQVFGERLRGVQRAGVAGALVGVVLLAAG